MMIVPGRVTCLHQYYYKPLWKTSYQVEFQVQSGGAEPLSHLLTLLLCKAGG